MDLSELKYKITKLAFLIGSFKYKRNKNLYLAFFLIVLLISATAFGIYLYQKSEITKKENILKSYFAELKGNSSEAGISGGPASSNKDQGSDISGNADPVQKEATNMSGSEETINSAGKSIKVYICGYVKNPGVYELDSDARIDGLLKASGGAKDNACLEAVNLAKKLADGEMVYIPSVDEVAGDGSIFDYIGGVTKTSQSSSTQEEGLAVININTASAGELESLPGIGETIAKDIIEYRETYGPFKTREELKNVKGIGEKKFEKVKELITI